MVDLQRNLQVLERIRTSNLSRWGFNFFEGPAWSRQNINTTEKFSQQEKRQAVGFLDQPHTVLIYIYIFPRAMYRKKSLACNRSEATGNSFYLGTIIMNIPAPIPSSSSRRHPASSPCSQLHESKKKLLHKNYFCLMRVSKVWHNRPIEG